MQRQITKLSAKFTHFEGKMASRRRILEMSLRLHTSLGQWREQCKVVIASLKQEALMQDRAQPQDDMVQQLRQIGDVILEEAGSLLELMLEIMKTGEALEEGEVHEGGGGVSPDYYRGIEHIRKLKEEVENHRRRIEQLMEAQKVHDEQLKQIDTCEKDAKQVRIM